MRTESSCHYPEISVATCRNLGEVSVEAKYEAESLIRTAEVSREMSVGTETTSVRAEVTVQIAIEIPD